MRRIRCHLTYSNVMVTILAFIVLTGGTAVALTGSNTVFTDDIANDTQPAGGGNPAGGLQAADLRPGSVGSSEVANNSIGSADLAPAARGARAYGSVDGGGNLNLTKSKNVISVTNPEAGIFCIKLASSINLASAVVVVSPDFAADSTGVGSANHALVEWYGAAPAGIGCPTGTTGVVTLISNGDETDDDDGGGNTTGDETVLDNESFVFVVP